MGRQPTRPGWYDDPDSGFARQAYFDGESWTGATRGFARHFRRLLIVATALVAFYGVRQLAESFDTWGWVETTGTVTAERRWYNGFWGERGVAVAHKDGLAFLYPAEDAPLHVGDRVSFYFNPDQPDFVEEPRPNNAFQEVNSWPIRNATVSRPLSHAMRALVSCAATAVLVLAIVWLRRREQRVPS